MKIYNNQNVFDAALDRIRYLFDEFPNVIVGFSGGKDSTVVFNLALIVAKEKERLPLKVMFIDQEAEWMATIDQVKRVMYNKNVEPYWYQMSLRLFNATSKYTHWLNCWGIGEKWIRKKDPISIKENRYNCDRFKKLFTAIIDTEYSDEPAIYLSGVRTEESPSRHMALTYQETYKGLTYGLKNNKMKNHYTFYPIYDWSYTDIWKAIGSNHWDYNKIYNYYYQDGVPFNQMRISNVHHETAVRALFLLQKYEPENYEKIVERIPGIDMAGKFGDEQYFLRRDLPYMFKNWKEYRDYLLENLIDEEHKKEFRDEFARNDYLYQYLKDINKLYRCHISSILTNDYHHTKINNFKARPVIGFYRQYVQGKRKYNEIGKKNRGQIIKGTYGKLRKSSN